MAGDDSEKEDNSEPDFDKPKPGWSKHYTTYVQTNFDAIFEKLYQEKFIDRLFDENDNNITKEKFITAVIGDLADKAEEFKDRLFQGM